MKFLNLAVLSACAFVSAQATAATFYDAIINGVIYAANNWNQKDLWGGFVLGLQYDPSKTDTDCYASFGTVYDDAVALVPNLIDIAAQQKTGGNNGLMAQFIDNPYFQPALYVMAVKRVHETGNLFYTFYE